MSIVPTSRRWGGIFRHPPSTRCCIGAAGARSYQNPPTRREIPLTVKNYKRIFSLIVQRAAIEAQIKSLSLSVRFEDEARFGIITSPAACWAPAGARPIVPNQALRTYTSAYGAVA